MKMEYVFWGINKYTGKLVGDATELHKYQGGEKLWLNGRAIDLTKPFGLRPVPSEIENLYPHDEHYVTEEELRSLLEQSNGLL